MDCSVCLWHGDDAVNFSFSDMEVPSAPLWRGDAEHGEADGGLDLRLGLWHGHHVVRMWCRSQHMVGDVVDLHVGDPVSCRCPTGRRSPSHCPRRTAGTITSGRPMRRRRMARAERPRRRSRRRTPARRYRGAAHGDELEGLGHGGDRRARYRRRACRLLAWKLPPPPGRSAGEGFAGAEIDGVARRLDPPASPGIADGSVVAGPWRRSAGGDRRARPTAGYGYRHRLPTRWPSRSLPRSASVSSTPAGQGSPGDQAGARAGMTAVGGAASPSSTADLDQLSGASGARSLPP